MGDIVNRVAQSSLIALDLEEYLHQGEKIIFDLKQALFQGMILREKDFRAFLKDHDWSAYKGKNVGLFCSADAIVPTWAYMLLVAKLKGVAETITFGQEDAIEKKIIEQAIAKCLSDNDFENKKVVVKGCGQIQNKAYAYTLLADHLVGVVSSLMFGEPCSTVPVYKKRK